MTSPSDIQPKRFFRFRGSQTVWYIVHRWDHTDDKPAGAEAINLDNAEAKVFDVEQLAKWLWPEVTASYRDVEDPQPDQRQTDVEDYCEQPTCLADMMGNV